jgi:hypothetical protein
MQASIHIHIKYFSLSLKLLRMYSLLGNDSVNIFRRKRVRATIGRPLLGNVPVNKPSQEYRGCVFCFVRAEEL